MGPVESTGAPTDPAYELTLNRGLRGDLAGARTEFHALAEAGTSTNLGAWSRYQEALAAKALGDRAGYGKLVADLQREHPAHPLARRVAERPAERPAAQPRKAAQADCGPRALAHLLARAGQDTPLETLRQRCGTSREGTTLEGLQQGAEKSGLHSEAVQVDAWYLRRHRPTGIAWVDGNHFVAFRPGDTETELALYDPNAGRETPVSVETLAERSQGIVLLLTRG